MPPKISDRHNTSLSVETTIEHEDVSSMVSNMQYIAGQTLILTKKCLEHGLMLEARVAQTVFKEVSGR